MRLLPFVTRKRFVRELREQREAFVAAEEAVHAQRRMAENALAMEQAAHVRDLKELLDITDNAEMRMQRDHYNDARIFSVRVTNTLLHKLDRATNPYKVAELVCRELAAQMIAADNERKML